MFVSAKCIDNPCIFAFYYLHNSNFRKAGFNDPFPDNGKEKLVKINIF
jgi:hypothetical protein